MPSAKAAFFYNEVASLPSIPASPCDSLVILFYMSVLCILQVYQFLTKLTMNYFKEDLPRRNHVSERNLFLSKKNKET